MKKFVVIPGGGFSDEALTLGDIPLGPWAGAEVETFTTKSGAVWHGDPNCPKLRSRGKSQKLQQPRSGSMDDLILPESLHCDPPGELGDHRAAAKSLMSFDTETRKAKESLDRSDLHIVILEERQRGAKVVDSLDEAWDRLRAERIKVKEEVRRRLRDRLPVMLAAQWIANGKTKGRHQERYASFLRLAEQEFTERHISATTGIRALINNDVLPYWLAQVTAGRHLDNIVKERAEREVEKARPWHENDEHVLKNIREGWLAVGAAWANLLEGIAFGYEDDIIAIFHEHSLGLNWDLNRIVPHSLPHAIVKTRQSGWVAARLPAIAQLFLKERRHGLIGLMLNDERSYMFNTERAALFLRNSMRHLRMPELAAHVHTNETQADRSWEERPDRDLPGFSTGLRDRGLTREQFLPALQAALHDEELPPPRTRR